MLSSCICCLPVCLKLVHIALHCIVPQLVKGWFVCRNINLNFPVACRIFIIYSPGIPPPTQPQGFIPFMFKSNFLRVVGILTRAFYYIEVIKLSKKKLFVRFPHQDTETLQYFVEYALLYKTQATVNLVRSHFSTFPICD